MVNFVTVLKEHNIAPSFQRIKILEYLHNHKTHPTAEIIYQALVDEIPTLSKTTVYNTLKIYVEKELLTELSLFENEVRYEYNTETHIHFKCKKCGKIFDLTEPFECLTNKNIDGHQIVEHHVNLKGICRDCRND